MTPSPDRPDESPRTGPGRAKRNSPLVLGLLSVGAIGFWWAVAPHVLSTLSLGLGARSFRQRAGRAQRRRQTAAVTLAGAVIVLSLANDLAALRGRAFLPRWE